MSDLSLEAARQAKSLAKDLVSRSAVVTGVGLARLDGEYAVKVNLRDPVAADLPREVNGVKLVYEQTGVITVR